MLGSAATTLAAALAPEFTTSIQIRKVTAGTSPLGGSTPTTATTLVTTTTGLLQEIDAEEAIEAGLTGERRAARVFLTEYAALQPTTHHLAAGGLTWEVKSILQLVGSHTEAVVELTSDG